MKTLFRRSMLWVLLMPFAVISSSCVKAGNEPLFTLYCDTIEAAYAESRFEKNGDNAEFLGLYCHVVEGLWCFKLSKEKIDTYQGDYNPEIEQYQLKENVSKKIINAIGIKYIEHSTRQGIKIRCWRDKKNNACAKCEINRGDRWEIVRVPGSRQSEVKP